MCALKVAYVVYVVYVAAHHLEEHAHESLLPRQFCSKQDDLLYIIVLLACDPIYYMLKINPR